MTTRPLAKRIAAGREDSSLRLRTGTVAVVNGDGTLDVKIGAAATAVGSVHYLADAYASPQVDDVVAILQAGTDLLVLGIFS